MKTVGVVHVDLERGPFGAASYLAEDIAGRSVLGHTVARLCRAQSLSEVVLLAAAEQHERIRNLLGETADSVTIEPPQSAPPLWRVHAESARKWARRGWRGGLCATTVFDEELNPPAAALAAKNRGADAVLHVPAAAVFVDPHILDQLIERQQTSTEDWLMTFSQAAPGLGGIVYRLKLLADLANANQYFGIVLSYRPDKARGDLLVKECNVRLDARITQSPHRYLADNARDMHRLRQIADRLDDPTTADALAVVQAHDNRYFEHDMLPEEIELELTTQRSSPHTVRPIVPDNLARGPIEQAVVERIADSLAHCDDVLVTLAGHGEPLLHPGWPDVVRTLTRAGAMGICLVTDGIHLCGENLNALMQLPVDVVHVRLDAPDKDLYAQMCGVEAYETVMANIDAFHEARTQAKRNTPILTVEMLKTIDTLELIESFYDRWMGTIGSAIITSPSHYARQIDDHAVVPMAPPGRVPCRQLDRFLCIAADGSVPLCDQDFRCTHVLGNVRDMSVEDAWRARDQLRMLHREGMYAQVPLCEACEEWHRP